MTKHLQLLALSPIYAARFKLSSNLTYTPMIGERINNQLKILWMHFQI